MNRVVPFAMKFVGLQIDMGKFVIRDLAPNGILAVVTSSGPSAVSVVLKKGGRVLRPIALPNSDFDKA
jgi:hypothetical protein